MMIITFGSVIQSMNDRKCTRIIIYSEQAINWCFINIRYFISSKQTLVDSFSYAILNFRTSVTTEQNETFLFFDSIFVETAHQIFGGKYFTYFFNISLSIIHLVNIVLCCHMVHTSFFSKC